MTQKTVTRITWAIFIAITIYLMTTGGSGGGGRDIDYEDEQHTTE